MRALVWWSLLGSVTYLAGVRSGRGQGELATLGRLAREHVREHGL